MLKIVILMWAVVIIFIILTMIYLSGKGAGLVAGFNTFSTEKQKQFDRKKVSRSVGILFLLVDIATIALVLYIQFRVFPSPHPELLKSEIEHVVTFFLIYIFTLVAIWLIRGYRRGK